MMMTRALRFTTLAAALMVLCLVNSGSRGPAASGDGPGDQKIEVEQPAQPGSAPTETPAEGEEGG